MIELNKKADVTLSLIPSEMSKLPNIITLLLELKHEIRISSDGYSTIIQANLNLEGDGGGFLWVEDNEVVVDGQFVNWELYEKEQGK